MGKDDGWKARTLEVSYQYRLGDDWEAMESRMFDAIAVVLHGKCPGVIEDVPECTADECLGWAWVGSSRPLEEEE